MLLHLGRTDLAIAALEVAKAVCESDGDVVPDVAKPFMKELEAFGLVPKADESLRFLRMKRKHRGKTTENHVVPPGTTGCHVVPDKNRAEQIREEKKREPRKRVAIASFDAWVPSQDHLDIAKEVGVDMAQQRTAMGDWLKSTGKTYKDYDAFARGWLRRARSAPTWKTAVNPLSCGNTDDTKTWKNPYGETL